MSTIIEDIDELQKQQAEIAVSAKEKYFKLTALLNDWEGLQSAVDKNVPALQKFVATGIEQLQAELLSLMNDWQELQSKIDERVENELSNIKDRIKNIRKITEQSSPPPETGQDNDDDDYGIGALGIGA